MVEQAPRQARGTSAHREMASQRTWQEARSSQEKRASEYDVHGGSSEWREGR